MNTLPALATHTTYAYPLLFWSVFVWAYAPEFMLIARPRPLAAVVNTSSSRILTVGLALAFAGAFALAGNPALRWTSTLANVGLFLGLAALVSGSLLRRHCWRVLGRFFTSHVALQHDQQVITSGAYAFIRHPSYSGALLMNVGVGLALRNWASAGLLLCASVALYSYRIAVEEQFLLNHIGAPYRDFMAGRKRLVPYVY